MKELTIHEMQLVSGGEYTEAQCVAGLMGAGAAAGAMLGAGVGFTIGAAAGQAVGQIICPATNNGNSYTNNSTSEDGDGG